MVSLATTVARRRIYYPRPVASLPDILMIDIPSRFSSERLCSGRFHPILIETIEEQSEIEEFLGQERDFLVAPDPFEERPSIFARQHLTIAHYGPSEAGWPFIQLCQWPAALVAKASSKDRMFLRGTYTFELFQTRKRLETATKILLESLDGRDAVHVETIFPNWSADPDAAPH